MNTGKRRCACALLMALLSAPEAHASGSDDSYRPDTATFLDFRRDYSGQGIDPHHNPVNVQARYQSLMREYILLPQDASGAHLTGYEEEATSAEQNKELYRQTLATLFEERHQTVALNELSSIMPRCYMHWNTEGIASNNFLSALAFDRAVLADPLVKEGHETLVRLRDGLLCGSGIHMSLQTLTPQQTGGYSNYLEAASDFYSGQYAVAAGKFSALETSASPWLKETALYMRPRILLIRSQSEWDGVSSPEGHIHQDLLAQAEAGFDAYLHLYPSGSYTASAQNLKRKVYYLKGDRQALNDSLKFALAASFEQARHDARRITEFEATAREYYRYYSGHTDYATAPAAVIAMAAVSDDVAPMNTINALQSHPERYRGLNGFEIMLEAIVYARNAQHDQVISLVEHSHDTLPQNAYVLLAESYASKGRIDKALAQWHSVQKQRGEPAIEWEIAYLHAGQNDYAGLVKDSAVDDVALQAGFATYFASLPDLNAAYGSKDDLSPGTRRVVELELMRRLLLSRDYAHLATLFKKTADAGPFKDAVNPVLRLAGHPRDLKAFMDIAFFLNQGMDPVQPLQYGDEVNGYRRPLQESPDPARCAHCMKDEQLKRLYDYPYRYFVQIEQRLKTSGRTGETEARLLHDMTECFHEGYRSHDCLWDQKEPDASRQAFRRLHEVYPDSPWAHKTRYYY